MAIPKALMIARSPWFALLLGLAVVVGSGALYGHYSQRWGPPIDLQAAGSHLKSLPAQLGEWQLKDELSMDQGTLTMLECAGYVSRKYVNQKTGGEVSIAIIVGPPGPTAVHTPEICYSSRNFDIKSKRKPWSVSDEESQPHSFWNVEFQTRDLLAERLTVYYAWSRGDIWEAAKSPRYKYAAQSKLFKIQLAGLFQSNSETDSQNPCADFLRALLASGWKLVDA